MRFAVIDLGTNTFNLLIAEYQEKGFRTCYSDRVGVGLGMGGINQGEITADATQRALDTLKRFKEKCEAYHVEWISAFGTSAIRNAKNGEAFAQTIQRKLEIPVEIISGAREAELIAAGVREGMPSDARYIIMDIGGGSTEFIVVENGSMTAARSFEIGAARIYQGFDLSDPVTEEDIQRVEAYLEKHTDGFFNHIQVDHLVGASGSFETFYELISDEDYPDHAFKKLEKDAMSQMITKILKSTLAEREQNERIIPIRRKMAPIAAIKIRWVMKKLGINEITISPYSLKEGVIFEKRKKK